jgi:hypothetical protein
MFGLGNLPRTAFVCGKCRPSSALLTDGTSDLSWWLCCDGADSQSRGGEESRSKRKTTRRSAVPPTRNWIGDSFDWSHSIGIRIFSAKMPVLRTSSVKLMVGDDGWPSIFCVEAGTALTPHVDGFKQIKCSQKGMGSCPCQLGIVRPCALALSMPSALFVSSQPGPPPAWVSHKPWRKERRGRSVARGQLPICLPVPWLRTRRATTRVSPYRERSRC